MKLHITRPGKLAILGDGGNCWLPLLEQFNGDAGTLADFLLETFASPDLNPARNAESASSFQSGHTLRLLRSSTLLAKARFGNGFGGFQGLAECLSEILRTRSDHARLQPGDPSPKRGATAILLLAGYQSGRISKGELDEILAYLDNHLPACARTNWRTMADIADEIRARLLIPSLRQIFEECPGNRRLAPEETAAEDVCLILCLSPDLPPDSIAAITLVVEKACGNRKYGS